MRGLCDNEESIDRSYILLRDTLAERNKTVFKGLSGLTNIIYNSMLKNWEIISLRELNGASGLILGFSNTTKFFPLGLQPWYMFEYCNKFSEQQMETFLKIAKVNSNQVDVGKSENKL